MNGRAVMARASPAAAMARSWSPAAHAASAASTAAAAASTSTTTSSGRLSR